MRFHDYKSVRDPSVAGSVDSFLDAVLAGKLKDRDGGPAVCRFVLLEKAWRIVNRPYYNVYPVVHSLCSKTTLDIQWERISFPFSPLLFRFPVGHEPFQIATALVYTVPPPNIGGWDYGELPVFDRHWAIDSHGFESHTTPCGKICTRDMCKDARESCSYITTKTLVCNVQFATQNGLFAFSWSLRSDSWQETVEETLSDYSAAPSRLEGKQHPSDVGLDAWGASEFLCRLSVLAALVGQGNDLITPEILARDTDRYEFASDTEKEWIEGRAARVNGRGFSFGKELQRDSEFSPHWRNPHMALFWTGEGRSVPVLKLRSGCVVSSTPLSDIPTGFLNSTDDDDDNSYPFERRIPVPKRLRFIVMRRDRYRCQLCGLTQADGVQLEVDHKVPVAKGGKTDADNLWTLCHPCNNGKSDSDLYA